MATIKRPMILLPFDTEMQDFFEQGIAEIECLLAKYMAFARYLDKRDHQEVPGYVIRSRY